MLVFYTHIFDSNRVSKLLLALALILVHNTNTAKQLAATTKQAHIMQRQRAMQHYTTLVTAAELLINAYNGQAKIVNSVENTARGLRYITHQGWFDNQFTIQSLAEHYSDQVASIALCNASDFLKKARKSVHYKRNGECASQCNALSGRILTGFESKRSEFNDDAQNTGEL